MRIWLFFAAVLALAAPYLPANGEPYSPDDELIYRINFGRADDVKLLLDKGANPNAFSTQGDTALTSAITRNDAEAMEMAKILLDKGADPNLQDKRGNYPLVMAARNGQATVVAALMDKKVNYHIKTADGTDAIDVAKQNGTPGVIAPIQAALDKEAADAASLRTPARFKEIIRRYAYYSCTYQYWSYFLSSRQSPGSDATTQKEIDEDKTQLSQLLMQIQTYYPRTKMADVQQVANDAAANIFKILDDMVSNRNRADKGIGKDEDAKQRCQTIATYTKVDFVPPELK